MTVAELRENLSALPPDTEVLVRTAEAGLVESTIAATDVRVENGRAVIVGDLEVAVAQEAFN